MCVCVCGLLPKCCQLPGPAATAAACLSVNVCVCVCCTCPKSAPAWYIIEPSMQHIAPHFARAPVAPFLCSLLLFLLLLLVLKFDNSIKCALWRKKGAKKKRTGKNSSSSSDGSEGSAAKGSRHGPRQGVTPSQSKSCTAVSTGHQHPLHPHSTLLTPPFLGHGFDDAFFPGTGSGYVFLAN